MPNQVGTVQRAVPIPPEVAKTTTTRRATDGLARCRTKPGNIPIVPQSLLQGVYVIRIYRTDPLRRVLCVALSYLDV